MRVGRRALLRGAVAAAGTAIAASLRANAPDPPRIGALLDSLDRLRAAADTPAYALAIAGPAGMRIATARGRLTGLDEDTPFRIGSITKSFTALAMARLAQARRIDIDRVPLRALAPDASFENPWEDARPLTVAMLLEHTAGFGELSRREWDYADPRRIDLAQGLAFDPSSRRVQWMPGVQHVYSNASPGLVAWAIERSQPKDFEQWTHAEVIAPLGLRHTGFRHEDASAARLVPGFRADGRTPIPYWHQHILAYGALHASASDMLRLLDMLLADGRAADGTAFLSGEAFARLLHPTTSLAARAGLALGYALGIYGSVREGFVFHGHGGDADGYLSRYGVLRGHGRGYYLAIDSDDPPQLERMRRAVESWLVADLPKPAPEPGHTDDPAAYEGVYARAATRFRGAGTATALHVVREGATLRLSGAVGGVLLPAAGVGQFRRWQEPVATSIFAAEGGQLYLQGDLGNFLRTNPRAQ